MAKGGRTRVGFYAGQVGISFILGKRSAGGLAASLKYFTLAADQGNEYAKRTLKESFPYEAPHAKTPGPSASACAHCGVVFFDLKACSHCFARNANCALAGGT